MINDLDQEIIRAQMQEAIELIASGNVIDGLIVLQEIRKRLEQS